MIPCCNDASSVDTSKWCNANLISLHFCAAFWEHFYSFSKCTAGTKEQKNILTLVLSHAKLQHVWSSQHPSVTKVKCHHNYQQFIRNVDKKNIEMLPMKIPFFFFEVWNEFFLPNINFKDGRWGIKPKKCVLHFCPHSYILGEKEYFWQLTTSPLRTLHLATISLVSIQYISFKGVLLCFSVQFCIL